jgi:ATP-dependent Clp protease ATP-binding subunit ClpA
MDRIRQASRPGALDARVRGQPVAVTKVLDMLKRSVFGLSGAHAGSIQGRPKGIMFFAGPTGVGKTLMAKSIAKVIFDTEEALLRFDMSEFSAEHSDARLIGAPPGYVGFEVGGELTNALRERPYRVILFDEIEKAHPRILDKFLQILEDGRLTDGRGETVYFSESIIIFTSNLGVFLTRKVGDEIIRVPNIDPDLDKYPEVDRKIREAVQEHFRYVLNRPEILNRIGLDNIVVFDFIQTAEAKAIFAISLEEVLDRLMTEKRINVTLAAEPKEKIEQHCISDRWNGGRGIGARLEGAFTNSLARALFDCAAKEGSSWTVTAFNELKTKNGGQIFGVQLKPED